MFVVNVPELKEKYKYETAPIKRLNPVELYGLNDSWYGGNIHQIAELRRSSLLLILDKDFNVLDVAVDKIEDLEYNYLKKHARNIGLDFIWNKASQEELIEMLGEA